MNFSRNLMVGYGIMLGLLISRLLIPVNSIYLDVGFILFGVVVTGWSIYYIQRNLVRPVELLKNKAQRIASGYLNEDGIKDTGAIGDLVQAFNGLISYYRELILGLIKKIDTVTVTSHQLSAIQKMPLMLPRK